MPYVNVHGVRLYYETHGEGPPLTLIEGIGYASWMWFRQVDALAAHYRLVIYDNRGVGSSDASPSPYTVRDMADDLAALLEALGIQRTHLLGVSSGGFTAQQFALAFPDRVDKLVLVATAMSGHPDKMAMPGETRQLMVPDASLPPELRIRKAMSVAFAPGYSDAQPELVRAIVKMRLESPPQSVVYRHKVRVFKQGYWRNPEDTAEVHDGDWFRTGDLVWHDDAPRYGGGWRWRGNSPQVRRTPQPVSRGGALTSHQGFSIVAEPFIMTTDRSGR